jgi:hypothetical protein
MKKDEIESQQIIVNKFEDELAKSITNIIPLPENRFLLITEQAHPNKFFVAEYYSEQDKPVLLKGEKRGPSLVVKDLVNIEAHRDISLGGVEQDKWE